MSLTSTQSDVQIAEPVPQAPAVIESISSPPTPPVEEVKQPGFFISMMKDFVRIELLNGSIKDYSYPDFADAVLKFQGALKAEEKINSTITLPRNTYALQQGKSRWKIAQFYPETNEIIDYLGTKRLSVLPNIIIVTTLVQAREGKFNVEEVKYLCTKAKYEEFDKSVPTGPAISRGIQILPFTNIYENGNMCYGNNSVPQEFTNFDFRGIRRYHDVILQGTFNNDLGVKALSRGAGIPEWFSLLATLAKEGKGFPYSNIGL